MAMVSKVGQCQLRNRTVRQRAWVGLPGVVRLGREMVAGRHAGVAGDGFGGLEGSLPAKVSEWPGSVAVLGKRPIARPATFSTRERGTAWERSSGRAETRRRGVVSRHWCETWRVIHPVPPDGVNGVPVRAAAPVLPDARVLQQYSLAPGQVG